MKRLPCTAQIAFFWLFLSSLLIFLLGLSPSLTEALYSRFLYIGISIAQRSISGHIPFPIGDFLYLLCIVYVIYRIVNAVLYMRSNPCKSEKWKAIIFQMLNFILVLYLVFKLSWGLNYSRRPLAFALGIAQEQFDTAELVKLTRLIIMRTNQSELLRKHRGIWSVSQLRKEAVESYQKQAQHNTSFSYVMPSVKAVLNSWVITRLGIEGFYNPLSGEANVNMNLPPTEQPFITCHEIAHQLGIGREDEANLAGYLSATGSDNPDFRYSGYYSILKNVLFELKLHSQEDYDRLYASINKQTVLDFNKDRQFWKTYNNDMFQYLDVTFDRLLKLNNQPKGTGSYQDIVLWVYNYHKQEL